MVALSQTKHFTFAMGATFEERSKCTRINIATHSKSLAAPGTTRCVSNNGVFDSTVLVTKFGLFLIVGWGEVLEWLKKLCEEQSCFFEVLQSPLAVGEPLC